MPYGSQHVERAEAVLDDILHLSSASELDVQRIRRAFNFALEAHEGQSRKALAKVFFYPTSRTRREPPWSSTVVQELYVFHPLAVAQMVAEKGGDAHAVCAALLHDVGEDCGKTHAEIRAIFGSGDENFGSAVASSVGLLSKPRWKPVEKKRGGGVWVRYGRPEYFKLGVPAEMKNEAYNAYHQRLMGSKDFRAALVKLCDRLHNLETAHTLPVEAQRREVAKTLNFVEVARKLDKGIYARMVGGIKRLRGAVRHQPVKKPDFNQIIRFASRDDVFVHTLLDAPEPGDPVGVLWGSIGDDFLDFEFPANYSRVEGLRLLDSFLKGYDFERVPSKTGASELETGRSIFRFRLNSESSEKQLEFQSILRKLNVMQLTYLKQGKKIQF